MKIHKTWRIIICLLLTVCIGGFSACAVEKEPDENGSEVKTAGEYEEIYDLISQMAESDNMYGGFFAAEDMEIAVEESETTNTMADSVTSGVAPDYSGTNVQVEGVDEGDIIKTDGKYIYMLRNGFITIVDAETLTELCTVETEGREYSGVNQMYVSGDKLAIIADIYSWTKYYIENGTEEGYNGDYTNETAVLIYDISDRRAPKLEKIFSQDGNIVSTRLIGSYLYTVSSKYIYEYQIEENNPATFIPSTAVDGEKALIACEDICIFPETESAAYNIITCVDIENGQQFTEIKAAFGGYGTVYADTDSLVLAFSKSESEETEGEENGENYIKTESRSTTAILLYDISNGKITEKASGSIPGTLLNQFSIDEYNGYYRFVTTDNRWSQTVYTDGLDRYEYDSSETNGLYILDNGLNTVGKIDELAKDENVKSVRFDGDVAYFVTFRQVDPLFTVDLSTPSSPKIMSELKIPGFSSYLHKYGEGRLLGLGFDADEETGWTQGLKLSMFDTSDPYNVTEKHKLILEEGWSEATYNHKAILVSVEKNLIAFPAEDGYFVYGYDDTNGFYLKNEVKLENWSGNSRGLFIGGNFYVCSDNSVKAFSLENFSAVGTLNLSDWANYDY